MWASEREAFRANLDKIPLKEPVCNACVMAFFRNIGFPVSDNEEPEHLGRSSEGCLALLRCVVMSLHRSMEDKKNMTIQAHLVELERRHQALEDKIAEALVHSSSDDLKVVEMKRQKLQLKDEIQRLRHGGAGGDRA